jgi:hypothetical protein
VLAVRRSTILLVLTTLLATQPASAATRSLDAPKHVKFGKVAVGSRKEVVVTLTNTGEGLVRVTSIGVSSDDGGFRLDFEAEGCVVTTLGPGQSCSYGIVFPPPTTGRLTGQSDVVYLSQDRGALVLIKLTGFGT